MGLDTSKERPDHVLKHLRQAPVHVSSNSIILNTRLGMPPSLLLCQVRKAALAPSRSCKCLKEPRSLGLPHHKESSALRDRPEDDKVSTTYVRQLRSSASARNRKPELGIKIPHSTNSRSDARHVLKGRASELISGPVSRYFRPSLKVGVVSIPRAMGAVDVVCFCHETRNFVREAQPRLHARTRGASGTGSGGRQPDEIPYSFDALPEDFLLCEVPFHARTLYSVGPPPLPARRPGGRPYCAGARRKTFAQQARKLLI